MHVKSVYAFLNCAVCMHVVPHPRHRLTPYEVSNSICLRRPFPGEGFAGLNAAGSSASVSPYISAIITSRTVAIISYCMSHCGFEGGNIPSDWNSIPLGNEKYVCTVYINLYTALHVHLTDYRVQRRHHRPRLALPSSCSLPRDAQTQ